MNAVEIEEAVSDLAAAPFDAHEFPFAFLTAFGNKPVTVQRLRAGSNNASDVAGGVLQRTNIHLAVCEPGRVGETLSALRNSPKTAANKVKFILATDGATIEAEELGSGETIACDFSDLSDHFGFFLPLAGISVVKEIKNNPFDIKATGRLNRLYVELLKDNPVWATAERRHELNQFMARLIFCFFAEDTGIFRPGQFTTTIELMSDSQSTNTHEVLAELFRAMDTDSRNGERQRQGVRSWADAFPFVNGGMFTGAKECPRFSRMARTYLLHVGKLEWDKINPDIFGSMIQAVADDAERGELGMHYTSVPNILKVLNPLFLDDLREKLEEAGDNLRKLRNLRRRIARIRVFDPACGSGNFLVIAYKEMREIERNIIQRTGDEARSLIRLDNFYGIEIKSFAAEIARLALLIAEFQCDVQMIGQLEARELVLPLHESGQIHIGNALRVDWLTVCPPVTLTTSEEWDMGGPTGRLALEDNGLSEAIEPETYICGNPPYLGAKKKSQDQIEDMVVAGLSDAKLLDYVCAFINKGLQMVASANCRMALVATSSICQGEQVALLWPSVLSVAHISFAYAPFKWANSAANNAGVFCTIVGLQGSRPSSKYLISGTTKKQCTDISPYLIEGPPVVCWPSKVSISGLAPMTMGSNAVDGKRLVLEPDDARKIVENYPEAAEFIREYGGTEELTSGLSRRCLWATDAQVLAATGIPPLARMIESCRAYREGAGRDARKAAKRPHAFCYSTYKNAPFIQVGNTIGNAYSYVPAMLRPAGFVSNHNAFTIYGTPLVELGVVLSKLHLTWAEAVAGRLGNGVRYGNTIVYNTFPMPALTATNRAELARTAAEILIAREAHFPSPLADLYKEGQMPENLRLAHEANDIVLERIYIGRRFRNDTERLEKLFELYSKMTAGRGEAKAKPGRTL